MKTKKGLALVIANADYLQQNKLPTCKKDGNDMQKVLEYLNFDVISGSDLKRTSMYDLILKFLETAELYSTILVYYTGHGVQIDGENYFVPIDCEYKNSKAIFTETQLVGINAITDFMTANPSKTNIMILDACRSNPGFSKDEFVSELCDLNKNLMYSMDIITIPTDEAVREVENKFLGVEKNITDWQMKQNRNNNFSAIIPYDMELQRKECKEFLDDLIVRDQRMMLCNITVVHLADSLEELDKDSETLKAVARKYVCELETLYFSKRQLDGLQTALPIGVNKLNITRTLLTESAAVFIPFRAHEIMQKGGIWYGQNAITNNPILCNKALLQNPNSFVLGIPGSGKSFLTKEEIEFLILSTNDDIIIADPEGEYDPIIKAMKGQIIRIGTNSKDYINAMDMSKGYGDSGNAIADKSQFIMSLFEQLDTNHGGISPIDRSIIDRCVSLVYQDAMNNNYIPTLKHLYNKLLEQSEPEAKSLAIKLELFTNGSLNIFAHETNVDIKSRILSFNIFNLGKQLKTMGLLVITDAIINRVNENWRKGKRTHVFIDEIHVIFENEESATFFASAWRQFRKRDAYPTGITQNVKYLLSSQQGTSMLSNSEFIVMLNQSANDREDLARLLNISEEQMGYITNAPTGSGLIKYGGSIVPFVNKMPKGLLYDLNTTKPGDRKIIL